MDLLLENISQEDLKKYLKEFYNYAKMELKLDRSPRLFLKEDQINADDMFGKTGYYDPHSEEIHLFITDRHAKDILRSFSHELVHHAQKLDGLTDKVDLSKTSNPAYASEDEGLRQMERDAFERGNMIFRDWCDGKKLERKKVMVEKKKKTKPQIKAAHKRAEEKLPSMIKQYGKEKGTKIAYASSWKKEENESVKQARKDALENIKHGLGRDVKKLKNEEEHNKLTENVDVNPNKHPYPELNDKKERLMKDLFNKREEIVYQELIRRFIKK